MEIARRFSRERSEICECGNHAFKPANHWGVILVSPDDRALLDAARWHQFQGLGRRANYAIGRVSGAQSEQRLHRLILQGAATVDHINRNGLDNRRSNLRSVDKFQSAQNRGRHNKTGMVLKRGAWEVRCQVAGKRLHIGSYREREVAEAAYRGAVHALHGDFADANLQRPLARAGQIWKPTERQLHVSIVAALRLKFPKAIVAHVPNEGERTPAQLGALIKMGLVPGMPDLVCILPGGRVCWLEVKTDTGRLSAAQVEIHYRLVGLGHAVHVVRSIDDALGAVRGDAA